jgi:hypothetical protein
LLGNIKTQNCLSCFHPNWKLRQSYNHMKEQQKEYCLSCFHPNWKLRQSYNHMPEQQKEYYYLYCFFIKKTSRKFRIRSFRIHHRTAKLLALLLSKKVWSLVLTLVQTNSDHVLKFLICIVHQILHPILKLQNRI